MIQVISLNVYFYFRILLRVVTINGQHQLQFESIGMSNKSSIRHARSSSLCVNDLLGSVGIALDVSNQQLIIQSNHTNDFYSCSSVSLCGCQLEVNTSELLPSVSVGEYGLYGLPAASLTVDYRFIYWKGPTDMLYYVDRRNPNVLLSRDYHGVKAIVSDTISQQPVPGAFHRVCVNDELC